MKVHWAVSGLSHLEAISKKINYLLYSFHYLQKSSDENKQNVVDILNRCSHGIIDSGLFTMMFGSEKNEKWDFNKISLKHDVYIDWVKESGYRHSIVEYDVQKILSPELAWDLRKQMRKKVKNTVINVYHLEDGNPDKLIKFSDYIAVSIPELRRNVSRKELISIGDYILKKSNARGIRVHMLGCTEKELLVRWQSAFSCDSSSWSSPMRYGVLKTRSKKMSLSIKTLFDFNYDKLNSKIDSNKKLIDQVITLQLEAYEKYAGSQE